MLDSVRSRLALWHTGVLAVLLIGFAGASDLWLERVVGRRDDRFLEESTSGFQANVAAELSEQPLDSALMQSFNEFRLRDASFIVLDAGDRFLAASLPQLVPTRGGNRRERGARQADTALVRSAVKAARASGGAQFATVGLGDAGQRLFILPVSEHGTQFTIVGVRSLADQGELLEDTRAGFLIAIPFGLLLAWIGGYALARRSLAPVATMTAQAAAISATSLHERLPSGNPRDELGQLARVFNDLLARLDTAFEHQRRFMADASHELRTPVSIMRGEADIALSRSERSADEYRGALEVVRAEGRRLSRIVGELFLLARADSGQQRLKVRALYLDDLVSECVHAVRSLALGRGITLRCSIDAAIAADTSRGDVHAYLGDEDLLRRLVVNLLDNAIKHAPPGSSVDVTLERDGTQHVLQVVDRGPGIPAAARDHIFERFFRADESHAREGASETGGAGLGLAIARWVAEAHGGMVTLVASSPGETTFEVRLPASKEAVQLPATVSL
ncbi:MAG: ATP-binding protein [Gemmatimonadota bacterium]|nr:ATP-binding protein [Gemmatimonadota bacterium]